MIYMGSAEDYEQEQEMEVEALQAILMEDIKGFSPSPNLQSVLPAFDHFCTERSINIDLNKFLAWFGPSLLMSLTHVTSPLEKSLKTM
jgi:hypothetical protein